MNPAGNALMGTSTGTDLDPNHSGVAAVLGPWIQTYTGHPWFLLDPQATDVSIFDIAHALSNICRFTGHTERFYSVAEHSVWVSHLVPREHALCGLLHDATEAYVGDVSSPLKALIPAYKEIEHRTWLAIAARFGLPIDLPAAIKKADLSMFETERQQLMSTSRMPWVRRSDLGPFTRRIQAVAPAAAETMFHARYAELTQVPAA